MLQRIIQWLIRIFPCPGTVRILERVKPPPDATPAAAKTATPGQGAPARPVGGTGND